MGQIQEITQESLMNIDLDIYNSIKELPKDHAAMYMRACFEQGKNESLITMHGSNNDLVSMMVSYMNSDEALKDVVLSGALSYVFQDKEKLTRFDKIYKALKTNKKQ